MISNILRRIMLKRYIWLLIAIALFAFKSFAPAARALELNEEIRTVPLNNPGKTITLTLEQAVRGKRLFNSTCGTCHAGGITKTDPNVNLEPDTLAGAIPPRNSIEGLVDYMKNPTTYDGFYSLAELHPNTQRSDLYPTMRNLTEEDLVAIAGNILIQPKVLGIRWGGGKIYF